MVMLADVESHQAGIHVGTLEHVGAQVARPQVSTPGHVSLGAQVDTAHVGLGSQVLE